MRMRDWSADVGSSDLDQIAYANRISRLARAKGMPVIWSRVGYKADAGDAGVWGTRTDTPDSLQNIKYDSERHAYDPRCEIDPDDRSEEHTSELQSLMRISYAVFCLNKKNHHNTRSHKVHQYNTTHSNQK